MKPCTIKKHALSYSKRECRWYVGWASDIALTTDRDQAIDFVHPDLAWTGSTHSCRSAVLYVVYLGITALCTSALLHSSLCVRSVSVSIINDRVQKHMREHKRG